MLKTRGRVSIIVNICLALLVMLGLGSTIARQCHSPVVSQKLLAIDASSSDTQAVQLSTRLSNSPVGEVCVGIFVLILLIGKGLFNRIGRPPKLLLLPEVFASRVRKLSQTQFVFTLTLPQLGISRT
ncbi:MAG: hypothetical protein H7227_04865 [Actinobacteria bacterium]|nr:hypothetical protein [Actinomycetota bacterium]